MAIYYYFRRITARFRISFSAVLLIAVKKRGLW